MSIGEIILVAIVGIVLFAVYSMRKKPSSDEREQGTFNSANRKTEGGNRNSESGNSGMYTRWLVGGGLGWIFGGPIGAILGIALGSMFGGSTSETAQYQGTPRGNFAISLLVLSAAVMKADQKVVKAELDFVRNFFVSQFGLDEGNRMITMLREILKQDINVQDVSVQIGQHTEYAVKLQLLHYLFGIAAADNLYHPDEVDLIGVIARYMGISTADFNSVKAMFVKSTEWAYEILEINPAATDDEVKKAYREMAKIHHPDKVASLGEDIKKAATEKFQKISAAYDEIKKQRGMA